MGTGNIGAGLLRLAGIRRVRAFAAAATGAAAVAAVIGLAVPAGAAPVAPARPAAVSGTEHFQAVTASATATKQPVIAWGPFAAGGVDHESTSNANTSTDLFVFSGGSFKVTHTGKSMSQGGNAKTCFFKFVEKGTYKLSGGTGKYKGISGHGTFTVTAIAIAAKTKAGKCNQNANPVAFQQIISASGPATLP
jgi:hypothetical protein